MWYGKSTQYSPVGLLLQAGSVRAIQLDRSGRVCGAAVENLASQTSDSSIDYEQAVIAILKRWWRNRLFRGWQVVLGIPSHELWIHNARLPQVPSEELPQVARFEAEERLPYAVDEAELRLILAGDVKQDGVAKHEVILLACRKTAIQQQIQICERAGLVPQAIDTESHALIRFQRAVDNSEKRTVFLHLGEKLSTVIFAEGDRILFLKYILVGNYQFDRAIAEELELTELEARQLRTSVSHAEELDADDDVHRSVIDAIRSLLETVTNEVEMCLRYCKVTFRGRPAGQLWLSGEGVSSWLADYLGDRFGMPVTLCRDTQPENHLTESLADQLPRHIGQIVHQSNSTPHGRSIYPDGAWVVALGLALRQFSLTTNLYQLAPSVRPKNHQLAAALAGEASDAMTPSAGEPPAGVPHD